MALWSPHDDDEQWRSYIDSPAADVNRSSVIKLDDDIVRFDRMLTVRTVKASPVRHHHLGLHHKCHARVETFGGEFITHRALGE
jgi:hypothetical protein